MSSAANEHAAGQQPTTGQTTQPREAAAADTRKPVLTVEGLKMHFRVRKGTFKRVESVVQAVDGLDFQVFEGETLGLVGESGCGKSTAGRAILRLYQPTAGRVLLHDVDDPTKTVDLCALTDRELLPWRRQVQMIFQDPYASLNPRMTVGDIIAEPLRVHRLRQGGAEERRRVQELMNLCGLNPGFVRRYPHEFSGGQRQRIGIARALAAEPRLIVCDEPISALDVSIQAQIMNLMVELQERLGLTYIFIAHDLSAVRHISDRITVMYLGRFAEIAPARELYANPLHPYTRALISAVPIPDPELEATRERIVLQGDLPSPSDPPSGCRFHTRCPWAWERCRKEVPPLYEAAPEHQVACHLIEEPERREER